MSTSSTLMKIGYIGCCLDWSQRAKFPLKEKLLQLARVINPPTGLAVSHGENVIRRCWVRHKKLWERAK